MCYVPFHRNDPNYWRIYKLNVSIIKFDFRFINNIQNNKSKLKTPETNIPLMDFDF